VKKLFLDSGPLIARINSMDPNNAIVMKALQSIKVRIPGRPAYSGLATSNYIIDESVTHVLYDTGRHEMAVKVLELIESSNLIQVLWIDEKIEHRAREIFRKYYDQTFSFTDCTSFALMEREEIDTAFTFDQHFRILNFTIIP